MDGDDDTEGVDGDDDTRVANLVITIPIPWNSKNYSETTFLS